MAAHLGGLLSDDVDLFLYEAACDAAKQEFTTAQFWLRVLERQFPLQDGYSLAPEVPPAPEGTGRRVDMGVFALYDREMHPLMFVEWKRAAKDTPGGRGAAEGQVLGYCEQYFDRNPGHPFMHAMVCAGGRGRIWRVDQDDESRTETRYIPKRAGPIYRCADRPFRCLVSSFRRGSTI